MITDSTYFKTDLIRFSKKLRCWCEENRWTDKRSYAIERGVFLAFYSIRKLIEGDRLSDTCRNQQISVTVYQPTGRLVTRLNNIQLDKLYDLDKPTQETRPLLFVCNQLIHSYLFYLTLDDNLGIIFSSDREKANALYTMDWTALCNICASVGSDFVTASHYYFDEKKQDYVGHNDGGPYVDGRWLTSGDPIVAEGKRNNDAPVV